MEALYCWIENELNSGLEKFCIEKKDKKARVVRKALRNYLELNGVLCCETTKRESPTVETIVCEGAGQPAA